MSDFDDWVLKNPELIKKAQKYVFITLAVVVACIIASAMAKL